MTRPPSGKKPGKPDSHGRLAAALRENLSRRKAQARARRVEDERARCAEEPPAGGAEEEKPSTQPPRGNKH